ncbi:molybdenum cofactor biosynthesis protein [Paenibacillus baekrokdamisoli]|uniref:Molybdenum cofactor biosynthesis protein n=1 Tax=Paenibacillus baekrokdamisoli TaxID=1712516 RepID=A0A3G9JBK2_9BACL|nr:MOSC N-terminal beta barrel domain-containing protein [Paenibacillus baekrokdamisoli]MBB3073349.1 hypothetical protein [Paenibacillus baekrokdamisoli]BBH22303.1 molybdenum cofactor biosynthesis protein [Paenibacillus baekrokdamisoli]
MTLISIGQLSQINRYPVKSFAGESLKTSKVETYGLYGDRCHAFIDETKQGWDSFVTARAIPNMLGYKAKLVGEGAEQEFPKVNITSPDGRNFNWDEELLNEIQPYYKRKITMKSYTAQKSDDLLAVDAGSILIITEFSLRKLEAIWGKRLDKRRFRANLVLSLDEDAFNESNWIGKRLVVGSTEIQADIFCERCSMITIDPDSLEKDASLLKKVNEEMNLHFGVYASVIKTGQINVGDRVYLVD